MTFSNIANNIYKRKYSLNGNESWEKTAWRVAYDTAKGEKIYGKDEDEILEIARNYYKFIEQM